MIDYLETALIALRPAFSRQATFTWFIIACIGFIMRSDTYGVSSIVRVLCLSPLCYPCLLHFFHSTAWTMDAIRRRWQQWLIGQKVEYRANGRIALTGDHTKNVKDGRKIPYVETLHQDSETSSKPTYFRGHHWGCLGMLTYAGKKFFSTPLWTEIHHDDLPDKRSTRIVSAALSICRSLQQKGYLILDAFFAVGPVFSIIKNCGSDDPDLHIITRAKKNVTAYMPAPKRKKKKRGPKPRYGKKLKLMKLFDSKRFPCQTVQADVYGSMELVTYRILDLLWKPVKSLVRFILIESSHGRIIIMTSDLSLDAQTALYLYCKRASIETLFNTLKNLLGALGYHFWSKYLQKSSRRPMKKNAPKPVSSRPDKTRKTLEAIEKFVTVQTIVLGILHCMTLKFHHEIVLRAHCWMRTPPSNIPSEFITKIAIVNIMNRNIASFAKNMITQVILKYRNMPENLNYFNEKAA